MLFIQSLDRQTIEIQKKKRQSANAPQNSHIAASIKAYKNYSTIASKFHSKNRKSPVFPSARKTLENPLPKKIIFTNRGILEKFNLEASNKQNMLKNLIKYKKRYKSTSFCNNLSSNLVPLPRANSPKIHINSIYNFNRSQKKYTKQIISEQTNQTTYRKSMNKHVTCSYENKLSERKRVNTDFKLILNQFEGWQTQSNNYDMATL